MQRPKSSRTHGRPKKKKTPTKTELMVFIVEDQEAPEEVIQLEDREFKEEVAVVGINKKTMMRKNKNITDLQEEVDHTEHQEVVNKIIINMKIRMIM